MPLVAIVPPDLPVKTLKEFVDLAKQKPGTLNFSSAGVASTSFLSAEIFRQQAKINIVHVPFRGAPEATTAVVRGDVQMYFAPIPSTVGAEHGQQSAGGRHQFGQARGAASGRSDDRGGRGAGLQVRLLVCA